jgi:hypothetical protein
MLSPHWGTGPSDIFPVPRVGPWSICPHPAPARLPHSQLEALVVFGGPAVVLGFGGKFSFLVTELGPNDVDLNERPEDARSLPLEVVGSYNCWGTQRGGLVRATLYNQNRRLKDYISQDARLARCSHVTEFWPMSCDRK